MAVDSQLHGIFRVAVVLLVRLGPLGWRLPNVRVRNDRGKFADQPKQFTVAIYQVTLLNRYNLRV